MSPLAVIAIAAAAVFLLWFLARISRRRARRAAERPTSYALGLDAMVAGEREAAVRHLKRAVREDPRNLDAVINLGDLLRQRGHVKQATQLHRELLVKRRLPKETRAAITQCLALDLAAAERWPEVIETLGGLSKPARMAIDMLVLLRDAHEATGALDQAMQAHAEILKRAPAEQPTMAIYRAHIGLIALRRGDAAKARAEFLTALKDDPAGTAVANLYLGDMAADEGSTDRALVFWMKLVADAPDQAHLAFERLEKAYFEMGDFGRMLGVYEDVVARAPSSTAALCGLSKMHERKGDMEEAARLAGEAIKHEGNTAVGHQRLIEVLVASARFEEASRTALAYLESISESADVETCPFCGEARDATHWRCAGCKAWTDAR